MEEKRLLPDKPYSARKFKRFTNVELVNGNQPFPSKVTPPEGYTLDTTKYEVSVTYEGQDVAEVTRELTVKDQVKKQAFQLIKVSEDGEQTETDLVAGAGFKVYLISDLTQVKNGKLKPANGESYTASDFKNYDFSKEQVAVTYENGTAVLVPELITDTKGYAVSPELPYGSYVVVESTTPENLKTIDPFVVNVENDSREPMQWSNILLTFNRNISILFHGLAGKILLKPFQLFFKSPDPVSTKLLWNNGDITLCIALYQICSTFFHHCCKRSIGIRPGNPGISCNLIPGLFSPFKKLSVNKSFLPG